MDLRIEDHSDPVPELRRIVTMQLAYELVDDEGEAAKAGRPAADRYAEAMRMAPTAYELCFWRGIDLAKAGDIEGARRELNIAFDADQRWRTSLAHLVAGGWEGMTAELGAQLAEGD